MGGFPPISYFKIFILGDLRAFQIIFFFYLTSVPRYTMIYLEDFIWSIIYITFTGGVCMGARMKKDKFNELCDEFKDKNKIEVLSDFSEYKNLKTKLKCRCVNCGLEQEKTVDKLLRGQGCGSRECKTKKQAKNAMLSRDVFDRRCREHKEKFDMTVIDEYEAYKGATKKIRLRCDKCGVEQEKRFADLGLYGCNNPTCSSKSTSFKGIMSRKEFDALVDYVYNKNKMIIITKYDDIDRFTDEVSVRCEICGYSGKKTLKNISYYGGGCPVCTNKKRGIKNNSEKKINITKEVITKEVEGPVGCELRKKSVKQDVIKCKICGKELKNSRALAGHIGAFHKMSMEKYTLENVLGGIRPKCPVCGKDTSFVRGKNVYREYCTEHANEARKVWSKKNGFGAKQDAGWKSGLTKDMHEGIKRQSEKISGENNPFFKMPKEERDKVIARQIQTKIENRSMIISEEKYSNYVSLLRDRDLEVLTKYDDYWSQKDYLDVRCIKCGKLQKKRLNSMIFSGTSCKYCSCSGPSKAESEIYDFVRSMFSDAIQGDRSILGGREIDIYVPSKKIGIEFNGLYWHSELHKEKKYHVNKWKDCKEKGVHLIQIFEDQWRDKEEIVKSIIAAKLGVVEEKIYARKTEIKKYETKKEMAEISQFMDENHLEGHTKSKIAFGLLYNGELVYAMSLRTPFTSAYSGSYEIARLAGKRNSVVIGGFSKLLKPVSEWLKQNKIKSLLTYADLKLGTGNVYLQNGFEHIGDTIGEYWYTDTMYRYNRYKYRAKDGLTEKQVAENSSVYRIYGVGSSRFLLTL